MRGKMSNIRLVAVQAILLMGGGEGCPSVAIEIVCCQFIAQICGGQHHMNICKDLSNTKKLVFNVKKLLNEGVDVTAQLRGGKKQCKGYESSLADLVC
jgi:hypothetical protein